MSIFRIRLFGIDCPEINQPYGDKTKLVVDELLNKEVYFVTRDIDRYGRTVADVYYRDTLVSLSLIRKGLGWHYKKYSSDPVFADAEISARDNSVGLWEDEGPIAPWDWRSGNFNHALIHSDTTGKVFVCVGPEEMEFHHVLFCENLKDCSSTIIIILPEEAMTVYRKFKCLKCLN